MELGSTKQRGPVRTSGSALALAIHCALVHAGFEPARHAASGWGFAWASRELPYAPPANWQSSTGYEWTVAYRHARKAFPITVVVSLHPKSGRVLVHASDGDDPENAPKNVCMLGLQLDKYIKLEDSELRAATSWASVLSNAEALVGSLTDHIVRPTLAHAETNVEHGGTWEQPSHVATSGVTLVAVGVCAVAVACILAACASSLAPSSPAHTSAL